MQDLIAWIAPVATMIAAMMTASNLGSRLTGWGFVVFTIGSIAWSIVAVLTDQTNLLLANLFLTLVNVVGVWRWLGRQARYDESSRAAARRSAASRVPTLFPASGLIGARILDRNGIAVATIVDATIGCDDRALAYIVASTGGIGGVGERLHGIDPQHLHFTARAIVTELDIAALPALDPECWPARPL